MQRSFTADSLISPNSIDKAIQAYEDLRAPDIKELTDIIQRNKALQRSAERTIEELEAKISDGHEFRMEEPTGATFDEPEEEVKHEFTQEEIDSIKAEIEEEKAKIKALKKEVDPTKKSLTAIREQIETIKAQAATNPNYIDFKEKQEQKAAASVTLADRFAALVGINKELKAGDKSIKSAPRRRVRVAVKMKTESTLEQFISSTLTTLKSLFGFESEKTDVAKDVKQLNAKETKPGIVKMYCGAHPICQYKKNTTDGGTAFNIASIKTPLTETALELIATSCAAEGVESIHIESGEPEDIERLIDLITEKSPGVTITTPDGKLAGESSDPEAAKPEDVELEEPKAATRSSLK